MQYRSYRSRSEIEVSRRRPLIWAHPVIPTWQQCRELYFCIFVRNLVMLLPAISLFPAHLVWSETDVQSLIRELRFKFRIRRLHPGCEQAHPGVRTGLVGERQMRCCSSILTCSVAISSAE